MQQWNECRIMKFVKKNVEASGEQLIHKLQKHNKAKVIFSRFCKYLYLWIEQKIKRLWPHCGKEEYYLECAFAIHYCGKIDVDIDDKWIA